MKSSKTLAIFNAIALAVTLIVNYMSNTGVFNGNTMETVSDAYHNLFTPAGYAFAIWGVIYLLLIGFVIYSFTILKKEKERGIIDRIGTKFIVTCVANSLWVITWLYDYTGVSVLIMIVLFIALLRIVSRTKMELTNPPLRVVAFVWWPFAVYSGWISVALIANISAYLTKIGWESIGISESTFTVTMLIVAGILHVFMTWRRNMREFAMVGTWALIAVAVSNESQSETVYLTALVVAAVIFLSAVIHGAIHFRGFGRSVEDFEIQ